MNGDDTFRIAPPVAVPKVRTTEVVAEVTFFVTDPTFFVTDPTFFVTDPTFFVTDPTFFVKLFAVRFAIFLEVPANPDASCITALDPSKMVSYLVKD